MYFLSRAFSGFSTSPQRLSPQLVPLSSIYYISDLLAVLDQELKSSIRPLLAAVYNRQIDSPTEIISHLKFPSRPDTTDDDDTPAALRAFDELDFEAKLKRFLKGNGHPRTRQIDDLLSSLGHIPTPQDRHDPLIRSCLFLRMMTSLDLRPIGDTWSLEVRTALSLRHFDPPFYVSPLLMHSHILFRSSLFTGSPT